MNLLRAIGRVRSIHLFRAIARTYRALGIFGLGFMVGGAYCSVLAALGREAITRLSGGAL